MRYVWRLTSGYGSPWSWLDLHPQWRTDLKLPSFSVEQVFPEVDFSTGAPIVSFMHRALGVMTAELIVLSTVTRDLKPQRIVELGTAEGRTTLNFALHSPPDAEVITMDISPSAGVLLDRHPLNRKVRRLVADTKSYDWTPYHDRVDLVLIDASDDYAGVRQESELALRLCSTKGLVFSHDYGNVAARTQYLNTLAERVPTLMHVQGTTLVVLGKSGYLGCGFRAGGRW